MSCIKCNGFAPHVFIYQKKKTVIAKYTLASGMLRLLISSHTVDWTRVTKRKRQGKIRSSYLACNRFAKRGISSQYCEWPFSSFRNSKKKKKKETTTKKEFTPLSCTHCHRWKKFSTIVEIVLKSFQFSFIKRVRSVDTRWRSFSR